MGDHLHLHPVAQVTNIVIRLKSNMPTPNPKRAVIWVTCYRCGNEARKHGVLLEHTKNCCEEDGYVLGIDYHRFVQCLGCESYKYVTSSIDTQEVDPVERREYGFKVYPDDPGTERGRIPSLTQDEFFNENGEALIPEKVWKMYKETLAALNNGALTLAAGGLRATVEAICLDKAITDGSLQNKIDELAKQSFLTASQSELLHEERYLGNAALHELETPHKNALNDGLDIVEGLITTIYILPAKAARLRQRRENR